MKHVLILGANGVLGSEITRQLALYKDIEQTCYDIRQISYKRINGRNICADVCDRKALEKAVAGQDYVVCSLNGNWYSQAQSLVEVLMHREDICMISRNSDRSCQRNSGIEL